ncbi:hypothetical protein A5657_08045 [Mycobacterium kubicae]|nr:hypothetical protein A5657_08045 [Mycobacterium kubicae]
MLGLGGEFDCAPGDSRDFDHFKVVPRQRGHCDYCARNPGSCGFTHHRVEVIEVTRIARGTIELTSESKHKGSRSTRTDTYRITVYRQ